MASSVQPGIGSSCYKVFMMRKTMIVEGLHREGWWYNASNSVKVKAKQELQIYLLQRKLFDPPSGASDDGILAFQTFTALGARHDGERRLESKWSWI